MIVRRTIIRSPPPNRRGLTKTCGTHGSSSFASPSSSLWRRRSWCLRLSPRNTDDPASKQYNPPIPEQTGAGVGVAGDEGGGGDDDGGSGLNATIGSLPFTGMDLLIVAGVAFLLTGTGFALRRLSMPKGPSTLGPSFRKGRR